MFRSHGELGRYGVASGVLAVEERRCVSDRANRLHAAGGVVEVLFQVE